MELSDKVFIGFDGYRTSALRPQEYYSFADKPINGLLGKLAELGVAINPSTSFATIADNTAGHDTPLTPNLDPKNIQAYILMNDRWTIKLGIAAEKSKAVNSPHGGIVMGGTFHSREGIEAEVKYIGGVNSDIAKRFNDVKIMIQEFYTKKTPFPYRILNEDREKPKFLDRLRDKKESNFFARMAEYFGRQAGD